MITNGLSDSELSLAYSRLFRLIADLFHHGLTVENLVHVQEIPVMADSVTLPINWETAAADHHHLFRFNVFAYESTFLDPSGLLGGSIASQNLRIYHDSGFQGLAMPEAPDHITTQVKFLAYLEEVQTRGAPQGAKRAKKQSADFIDAHLLNWMAPFTLAVRQQGHSFYVSLVNLTLEALGQYRFGLGKVGEPKSMTAPLPPEQQIVIGGPRELANYLIAPVYSGIYLGRDDIAAVANRLSLPRGFGQRKQMLQNLIHSAVTYDQTSKFIAELGLILLCWEKSYIELDDQLGPLLPAASWLGRLRRTKEVLEELSREIQG